MLFSQRKGFKPIKNVIQVEDMDDELRNGLWNALSIHYWELAKNEDLINKALRPLCRDLWVYYFKLPIDTLGYDYYQSYKKIRDYFFKAKWYEVYDFIEFVAKNFVFIHINEEFIEFCNSILKSELSGYRFVGGKITQTTSEEEILEIEEALRIQDPFMNAKTHIKTALDLLADRKSPNYRNSIKESISAVEAVCILIAKTPKGTLGQALKEIEDKVNLHPALKKAFDCLYGYTSDADGIRHAIFDEPNLTFEDAKFMLVSCSAFVNYLIAKTSQAKIKF